MYETLFDPSRDLPGDRLVRPYCHAGQHCWYDYGREVDGSACKSKPTQAAMKPLLARSIQTKRMYGKLDKRCKLAILMWLCVDTYISVLNAVPKSNFSHQFTWNYLSNIMNLHKSYNCLHNLYVIPKLYAVSNINTFGLCRVRNTARKIIIFISLNQYGNDSDV